MPLSRLLFVQKQKSDAHVDLAAYDHATLAFTAALSDDEGSAQLSELPVLAVAPWNQRPGYLVSFQSSLSAITMECRCRAPCLWMHERADQFLITRSADLHVATSEAPVQCMAGPLDAGARA